MLRIVRLVLVLWQILWIGPLAAAPAQTLSEPWDLYWHRWLTPRDLDQVADYQIVPNRGWTNLPDKVTGQPLGTRGYATYRYELKGLSPRGEGYELQFP